jgi:hypothetical protein
VFIPSLDSRRVDLGDDRDGGIKCVSKQAIAVMVFEAVLIYKVGDDQGRKPI